MDGKDLVFPEKGSPQGSVISPLLANVYLHEVLDTWFAEVVTAHCRGKVVMYRYADDFVIGCELESDARRIMKAIPQRFAKYGLEINEEKTRMISFRRPPRRTTRDERMARNQARSASWALPITGARPRRDGTRSNGKRTAAG